MPRDRVSARRFHVSHFALPLLLLLGAADAAPTTAPAVTSAPAVDPALRQAVTDLANADDAVRAAARARLLGLPASRLSDLAAAVRAVRPLLPSQSEILRDVVRHVYLTGLPYERTNMGFLGITMAPADEVVRVQKHGEPPDQADERLGVRVTHRWPGFAGYRWLLDGDVILSVEEFPPDANGAQGFGEYVRQHHPGDRITLHVLRQGQIIRVPIVLDARPPFPAGAGADVATAFVTDRDNQADQYWQTTFAPAIE